MRLFCLSSQRKSDKLNKLRDYDGRGVFRIKKQVMTIAFDNLTMEEAVECAMAHIAERTRCRVVTPNASASLIETFSYYFINSMVTISALIFIVGSKTMILTAKIKQLQYINQYNEVFVLSLLILATNLLAKAIFTWLANNREKKATKQTEEKGN